MEDIMQLFRLMDMDDGTDERTRGPRGLLDFEWFDRYARGGLPSMQGGVMGNLVAAPKDPNDPVWSVLDRGLPWPVRRPYPAVGWPFDPQPPALCRTCAALAGRRAAVSR